MTIEIQPLSEALGAAVIGVDLSKPVDDETFEQIHDAHLEYAVVVFRDQDLTPEQHIAFSRRFGDLDVHVLNQYLLPGHPEILLVSNKEVDGKAVGQRQAGSHWHSDLSYTMYPSLGSLLYALEIPPEGGDTLFTNMYAAYDALSDKMKARVNDLKAVHSYAHIFELSEKEGNPRPTLTQEQKAKVPEVIHPVVRTHPETGRKALYVSPGLTAGIVGMDEEEGRGLLAELHRHSISPEFVYRHKWRRHDLLFWDNRCTMHLAAGGYDPKYTRHLQRTTVKGDRPV